MEAINITVPSYCSIVQSGEPAVKAKPAIGKVEDISSILTEAKRFLSLNDPTAPIQPACGAMNPQDSMNMEPAVELCGGSDSDSSSEGDCDGEEPGVVMEVGLGVFDVAGDVPTEAVAGARGMTLVDIDPEERWGKPAPMIQEIERE
eukprot:GEMP01079426.1.p1 GENE.GEMP01079426.1~~GEMP01079426.1.p1  ORF type:complete len:147 (+),score=31.15 GEMP01079426.1:35-475(+)